MLKAEVSGGMWSYIVNEKGNALRITLAGFGSCTPISALNEWISKLTPAQKREWSDKCDEARNIKD